MKKIRKTGSSVLRSSFIILCVACFVLVMAGGFYFFVPGSSVDVQAQCPDNPGFVRMALYNEVNCIASISMINVYFNESELVPVTLRNTTWLPREEGNVSFVFSSGDGSFFPQFIPSWVGSSRVSVECFFPSVYAPSSVCVPREVFDRVERFVFTQSYFQ